MKNFCKTGVIVFFLFTFSFLPGFSQSVKHVDVATFKQHMNKKNTVLIDLRTDDEISKKGKIPGSVQIDFFSADASEKIKKLDKGKTYLIYCAGGGRSGECAELMEKEGFTHIINLEKGFDDWKRRGEAVEFKTN